MNYRALKPTWGRKKIRGKTKKVSGELSLYFESNKEKKLTDRLWQTKLFFPSLLPSFLSPLSRPLIAVSSRTSPSFSSSFSLFRLRIEELCLCHDHTLLLIVVT